MALITRFDTDDMADKCFKCGEVGNRRFECPNKGKSRQQGTSKQPPDRAATAGQRGVSQI